MPSKVKANAVAAGSAGFLKPTFSSLCKVVERCDPKFPYPEKKSANPIVEPRKNSVSKSRHSKSPREQTLPPGVHGSSLHSSLTAPREIQIPAPPSSFSKANGDSKVEVLSINSMDEVGKCEYSHTGSAFLSKEENANEVKIKDARRVCDELRMQIEGLKIQQNEFQSRIGRDLDPDKDELISGDKGRSVVEEVSKDHDDPEATKNNTECEGGQNADTVNKRHADLKILSNIVDGMDSFVTEDSFNLHGSVTSSEIADFSPKEEWLELKGLSKDAASSVVIKKLVSERERYKKKVRRLQSEMNKLKKHRSNINSRSPDIAAHDIIYFNADLIGEGHLSYVYSGTMYKNQKVAIKKLIRPDMMSSSDRSYLAAEAGLLMTLHHQNIVEVYGVSTAPLQPLIVTELVKGKNLQDRLSSNGWPLSPVEYYSISRDVAVGMAYLHGQKPPVLHLNLRPCNVLIDMNGRAKISDFGFSKIRLDAGMSSQVNLAYLAPELLAFPVHLTTKLDVYSYAMILWKMATMKEPYDKLKASQIMDVVSSGKRLDIPCELPSGFHAIISRCWDGSAMQRPSFKEVIILLETMILPEAWVRAIDSSELQRADTRGIITPRDGTGGHATAVVDGDFERRDTHRPRHQETKRNGAVNSNRRRISEELALESDMMSLGYVLHKNENSRQDSDKYLRGFSPKSATHHSHPNTPTRSNSRHRSLRAKLSPYKYSFINTSPISPSQYYGRYSSQNGERHFSSPSKTRYLAARNLNNEWRTQADKGQPQPSDCGIAENGSAKYKTQKQNDNTLHNNPMSNLGSSVAAFHGKEGTDTALLSDNRDQHVLDTPVERSTAAPIPLMNADLRYHDQQLCVETPKVMTGKTDDTSKLRSPNDIVGIENQEDMKNAVAIPYLKNLRSGDEVSSSSSTVTSRSQFDERLNSYVTDACHAESRNYVNAKGWRSDRSLLLNNPTSLPASDQIKVHSVDSRSAAVGQGRRIPSSGISESPETVMTAVFQPSQEKRRDLKRRDTKYDDIISFTSSDDNSVDSSYGVAIASVPSTYLTSGVTGDIQPSQGGFYRPRQLSDCRERRPSQQRYLRRENSWNKLKNSYSPEPLIPHFASGIESGPNRSPTLSGNEHAAKPNAFNSIRSRSKHSSKSRRKDSTKSDPTRMNNGYPETFPSNGAESNETDGGSTSTLSGPTTDEVGETLRDTARELAGVSGILHTAAKQRNTKQNNGKQRQKN